MIAIDGKCYRATEDGTVVEAGDDRGGKAEKYLESRLNHAQIITEFRFQSAEDAYQAALLMFPRIARRIRTEKRNFGKTFITMMLGGTNLCTKAIGRGDRQEASNIFTLVLGLGLIFLVGSFLIVCVFKVRVILIS